MDYEEVCEEIGAFLFENEFEGDFLRDLDSATRTWWNGLKGKFKEAFGAVGGTEGADAHDAVRELMKAFEEGRGVKSEEGTESGTEGTAGTRGTEEERTQETERTEGPDSGERWSAAAMNRTGTIPDGKSLQEVVSGIMQNNSVSVKGKLSKDVSAVADFWSETSSTSARRALSGVLLAAIPEEMRSVKLKDGRIVEITLNGIANILQHMPNAKGSFRNGALEFILHLPEFLSSAEEFYREFKGSDHCNFGGIVDFNGTEFYVSVTCTSAGNSLRVKAVNSIKKSSLDAWTETTTAEKRGSSSESVLRAASKLDMADVLKWLFLNQEKTVGDFDSWMRSNRARLEEAEARKRQSERQSRVRPGVGLDVSRNGMNERKGSADDQFLEESDFGEDGRVKPEVLAEIEAEKAKIREDAQKNGTWMKAPNGAPSKLNAEQWVLVRTKRFKRWFGDWEAAAKRKDGKDAGDIGDNGDEGVSKVVDENGDTVADYASSDRGYPGKEWYERSLEEAVNAIFSVSNNYVETSDSDILGELFSVWGGESALRGVAEVLGYDGFIPKRTLSDDVKIAFFFRSRSRARRRTRGRMRAGTRT